MTNALAYFGRAAIWATGEKRLCHWSLIRAKEPSFFFALESSSRSLIFDQLSWLDRKQRWALLEQTGPNVRNFFSSSSLALQDKLECFFKFAFAGDRLDHFYLLSLIEMLQEPPWLSIMFVLGKLLSASLLFASKARSLPEWLTLRCPILYRLVAWLCTTSVSAPLSL